MKNTLLILLCSVALFACAKKQDNPEPQFSKAFQEETPYCHGKDSSYSVFKMNSVNDTLNNYSFVETCSTLTVNYKKINVTEVITLPEYDSKKGHEIRKYSLGEEQNGYFTSTNPNKFDWRIVRNASGILTVYVQQGNSSGVTFNSRLGYNPNYNN